jgi:metal-sulfur cluster biosynthetic enzyme
VLVTNTPVASEDLWAALVDVEDPEFAVSVVDLGLIVDIRRDHSRVGVDITFTAMGCPATEMIIDDVRDRLMREPDVTSVDVNVVWDPIWTASRLSATGRLALNEMGIAV